MPSEADFQEWYANYARKLGLAPNPDDPQHFYDYRAAYRAGAMPDKSGHWPSQFKLAGHPRMVIGGVNTRTGRKVMPSDEEKRRRATKRLQKYSAEGKMPRAGLSEYWRRRKKTEKLEASRKAAAKARTGRGPATTQEQLRARQKGMAKTPVPLTPSQEAEKTREGLMPKMSWRDRLLEVLGKGKKK